MSAVLAKSGLPRKRDVVDAALYRRRLASEIAGQLEASALAVGDVEALAVADMLKEAGRLENIYHGEDAHNADGELYDPYGSLVHTSSRLDPAYMAMSSRRARRGVTAALERVKPQSGERLRFLTLTMPATSADFEQTVELLDAALVLLKKRKWFREVVRGAAFGVEFTLGEAGAHWHVHCHVLAWSKWLKWSELGEQWTDCLKSAAAKLGRTLTFPTSHGRAVVDVRLVTAKRGGKGTISLSDAVAEACKYIVKGSDFASVPASELCKVEKTLFRRRMVETFGECNSRKGKASEAGDTYLDTQNIIDGSPVEVESTGEDKAEGAEAGTSPRPTRRRPLREVGAEMIREGRRDEWLEMLSEVYRQRREFRRAQLARRFPWATFRTLGGDVWRGAYATT